MRGRRVGRRARARAVFTSDSPSQNRVRRSRHDISTGGRVACAAASRPSDPTDQSDPGLPPAPESCHTILTSSGAGSTHARGTQWTSLVLGASSESVATIPSATCVSASAGTGCQKKTGVVPDWSAHTRWNLMQIV